MPSGDNMESSMDQSVGMDANAPEVMESLGEEPAQSENESQDVDGEASKGQSNETLAVQKRLKAQKRSHEREIRELHARIADMQQKLTPTSHHETANPYAPQPGSVEEHIHKAVSFALNHKDMEERKAKEAEHAQQIQKEYRELHKHLDSMGDKYDDFHDIVFGDEAQFTPTMRDYAMTLPKKGKASAGELLYQLGKNGEELERIAKLPPYRQAQEMAVLRDALLSGGDTKAQTPRPLGQIKTNPVTNSRVITDKTPVSELRRQMKAGWK